MNQTLYKCIKHGEDCTSFCVLLRKSELYPSRKSQFQPFGFQHPCSDLQKLIGDKQKPLFVVVFVRPLLIAFGCNQPYLALCVIFDFRWQFYEQPGLCAVAAKVPSPIESAGGIEKESAIGITIAHQNLWALIQRLQ